jgi:hypothetical protein
MRLIAFILICLTLFHACSNKGREQGRQIRTLYSQKQFDKAIDVLEKSELKSDSKSQVLYHMELGSLYFAKQYYLQATEQWEKARKLIEEYYTVSITQRAATFLYNDTVENYYGEPFEISQLYFHLSLAYYFIAKSGKTHQYDAEKKQFLLNEIPNNEKRRYLFAARATVVAWDSFFQTLQRSNRATLYQSDLLVKLVGAFIHQEIGGNDLQIALQLYQDALVILYSLVPTYASFNSDYINYIKNTKLESLKRTARPDKHFAPTELFNRLEKFLKQRLYNITHKHRRNSLAELTKRFQLQGLKPTQDELSVLLTRDLIAEKKAKPINLGLKGLMDQVEDPTTRKFIQAVGVTVLSYFAMNTLKLVPKDRAMTYGEFVYARNVSEIAVQEIAIEFEVPMIENKLATPVKLELDETELTSEMALITSVGDLARIAMEESAALRLTKVGVRVGVKYILAIVAAYKVYDMNKSKPWAGTLAVAQFIVSSKAILASESADTRYWSLLPSEIYWGEFSKLTESKKVKLTISPELKREVSLPSTENFFSYHL